MSKKTGNLSPIKVGVKNLSTKDLISNPHNPRMLFDREPLEILQESIKKVGILVPLTVYFDPHNKKHIILDGQRRWLCAQELDLETVPANEVAKPTLVQNIVTMFQIHKLREDWELMPTALKLELLMEELDEKNNKKLSELTRLDQAVVSRCKKLLSYPKKYQDMMLDPDPAKRIKADFFIELYPVRNDRFINKFKWYKQDYFTKAMLSRYKAKKLKSVTDFRIIKQYINNARKANKTKQISRVLKEFTEDESLPLDHLKLSGATVAAEARKIVKTSDKLIEQLGPLHPADFIGEEHLWKTLKSLLDIIKKKLFDADRRI